MGHSLPLLLPHSDWLTAHQAAKLTLRVHTHFLCPFGCALGELTLEKLYCMYLGGQGGTGQSVWRMGPCEVSRSSRPGLAHFYSGSALMRKQLRVEVGEDRPLSTRSQTSSDARLWWGLERMGDGRRFPTHFSPEAGARWCRVAQGPGCPP